MPTVSTMSQSPLRRAALLSAAGLLVGTIWGLAMPILGLSGWAPGRLSLTLDLVAGVPSAIAGALFVGSAIVAWPRLEEEPESERWATATLVVLAAFVGCVLLAVALVVLIAAAVR
jgi:zinc transporter ZupT